MRRVVSIKGFVLRTVNLFVRLAKEDRGSYRSIIVFLFALCITIKSTGQSPGNVSGGLIWWLKANAGVYTNNGTSTATNNQAVQQWNDQSGSGTHARQTTGANKPVYLTGQINGNPALQFSGDQFLTALSTPGVGSTNSFHMFVVLEQDSYTSGTMGDGNGTYIIDRTPETDNLMSLKITTTDRFTYQKRNNSGGNLEGPISNTSAPLGTYTIVDFSRTYNTSYDIYISGRLDVTSNVNAGDAITGPTIQIGRHAIDANQGLNGKIAEVVLYNTALTTTNRRKVESYLAVKYGITLDQTTLTDYTNSAGTVIYPVASNAAYNAYHYDIGGIGRDNNSALNQTASQSQNSNTMINVSNASSLGNGDFLVWGNNGANLATTNTTDVGGIIDVRLSRVWKVAHTNNAGTVTLSIDLSNVTGPMVQSDLRLMIDRNGNGFSDNDVTPKTGTLTGSVFKVTGVTLQNGDYFTVGSTNIGTTPLPIELLEFVVAVDQNQTVTASWKTTMEKNNDFFTLENSVDGNQWNKIGELKSHGNSFKVESYTLIDPSPLTGSSYYRLKQTDLDGTVTTFSVKRVTISASRERLILYPNPGNGTTITFQLTDTPLVIQHVDIVDQTGLNVLSTSPATPPIPTSEYSIVIDKAISPGLYTVKVYYNERIDFIKLVVL